MLDVVDAQAELRHLHGRLRAEVDEQRRLTLDDDEVALEHPGRECGTNTERDDAQVAVSRERQLPFVAPDTDTGGDEGGLVYTEIEFDTLEHGILLPELKGQLQQLLLQLSFDGDIFTTM